MSDLGFDDDSILRLYWVNRFLDVTSEPEDDLVAMVVSIAPITELVEALQSDNAEVRSRATQMLWHLWMSAAGDLAYDELVYGMDLVEDERWDEALGTFSQLVETLPDFAEAYNKRATTYYLMGRYEEAIADARRTIELNPSHFGAWHGLGLCHIARQEWERAINALLRAQKLQPFAEENDHLLAYCRNMARTSESPDSKADP